MTTNKHKVSTKLITPTVLSFIRGDVSEICTPLNVKHLLTFKSSAFWDNYKDAWSTFVKLRKNINEKIYQPDSITMVDGDIDIKLSGNDINEKVLAILTIYLKQLGWGDYRLQSAGYYISNLSSATLYTLSLSTVENRYAVSE